MSESQPSNVFAPSYNHHPSAPPQPLEAVREWVDTLVSIITCDGRNIIGILRGFDHTINLILDDTHERILANIDTAAPAQRVALGLYLIRGDNVAIIGEFDEIRDLELKVDQRPTKTIKPVTH